jgi:uncharacterized membrane protein YfcA
MRWFSTLRRLPSRLLESAAAVMEVVASLGLVSGTAVALVLGRFALAGILALVLLGIVLRFMRRRVREHDPDAQRRSA